MWQMILETGLLIVGMRMLYKKTNWIMKAMMEFTIFLTITVAACLIIFGALVSK